MTYIIRVNNKILTRSESPCHSRVGEHFSQQRVPQIIDKLEFPLVAPSETSFFLRRVATISKRAYFLHSGDRLKWFRTTIVREKSAETILYPIHKILSLESWTYSINCENTRKMDKEPRLEIG